MCESVWNIRHKNGTVTKVLITIRNEQNKQNRHFNFSCRFWTTSHILLYSLNFRCHLLIQLHHLNLIADTILAF